MIYCTSLFGTHQYEARYEEVDRELPKGVRFSGAAVPSELRTLTTMQRYVRDICVLCGHTVERGG